MFRFVLWVILAVAILFLLNAITALVVSIFQWPYETTFVDALFFLSDISTVSLFIAIVLREKDEDEEEDETPTTVKTGGPIIDIGKGVLSIIIFYALFWFNTRNIELLTHQRISLAIYALIIGIILTLTLVAVREIVEEMLDEHP